MSDINKELTAIGDLLRSASELATIREEVRRVLGGQHVSIVDGEHSVGSRYDFVVSHNATQDETDKIARRIRSRIPESIVEHIVDNMLGIKMSRRT